MNWLQLIYQYGVGGMFFVISLALCFRSGAADRRNASDRRTLTLCVVGLGAYFLATLVWILAAG
jgi:hypothetical protein